MDGIERKTDGGLPPGCRQADLSRGETRSPDFSPDVLWGLLDDEHRQFLYRHFFRSQCDELSELMEQSASAGAQIRARWLAWRDETLRRLAGDGSFALPREER